VDSEDIKILISFVSSSKQIGYTNSLLQ
jgi:hypothetical protein